MERKEKAGGEERGIKEGGEQRKWRAKRMAKEEQKEAGERKKIKDGKEKRWITQAEKKWRR